MLIISIIKVLLILALFIYVLQRKDKDYLLKIAFFFTFASDVILALATANTSSTVLNYSDLLPLGTMVFCFAQFAYFARHCPKKLVALIYIPLASLALITIFTLSQTVITPSCSVCDVLPEPVIEPETALMFYALIYALTEVFNLIFTLKQDRRTALGFALFIACDLTIALGFVNLAPAALTDQLCWVFYLPAQILLAISPKPMLK